MLSQSGRFWSTIQWTKSRYTGNLSVYARGKQAGTIARVVATIWLSSLGFGKPQPNPAPGLAALKQLSLEQLSQLEVVSPTKEPVPAFKSPVAIYVITGEDIRRSGVTTIPDALRMAPGVEVAQIDASKWAIGIRGFGTRISRSVLVLMDGRTVYTPLFAGTYWEVQDTFLDDIDRIEVIRGPGGTIWGPNAVDGVINIITKSANETHGAMAKVSGGNQEQGSGSFRYGGETASGFNYRVYAKGFSRGAQSHPDSNRFDDWHGAQGGFRLDWARGARDSFTLQGDGYSQSDGEQVTVTNYTPPSTANVTGREELSGGNALFRWKRAFDADNDIQIQAFYDRTNRLEPNLGENRDTYDVDYLERAKAGRRHEFLFGAGVRVSQGRFQEVTTGLVFSPLKRTDYLLSAFLQDDFTLVPGKLTLSAGSKLLRTNYASLNFEPSVRLAWTPTSRQTFRASFTHALRTPSDGEHDFYLSSYLGTSNGVPTFARFDANPDFAPEQLNADEVGYRRLFGKNLFLDLSGFFNHYHDLFSEQVLSLSATGSGLPYPTAVPGPSSYTLIQAQFQNGLYGATYGGEATGEWRPMNGWRLHGSYSFLRISLHQAPTNTLSFGPAADEGSSPQHEVSLSSSLDLSTRLQLDMIYRYVSALSAQGVNAYSTGDARIGYKLGRHLDLSLVAQNILQPDHVEYMGDPGGPVAIRRSAYASLSWQTK